MKKKTKLLIMMLIFSLFMFGCGKEDKDTTVTDGDLQQDINEDAGSADEGIVADESATDDANIAIKGQELFSFNGLTVTAKDVTFEKLFVEGIDVIIENNSDEAYTIKCETAILNDYTYGAIFMEDVPAGETKESYVSMWGMEAFFKPEEIAKVALLFEVRDSSYSVVFNSGAIEMKTTKADEVVITKPEGGNVIYDAGNIRVTSLGLVLDDSHGWHIRLFVENNTDEFINLDCDKALVNGEEIETLYHTNVCPGKMGLSDFTFYSAMSSYEFEDIEDIVIAFRITNVDTYDLVENTDIISVPVVMAE